MAGKPGGPEAGKGKEGNGIRLSAHAIRPTEGSRMAYSFVIRRESNTESRFRPMPHAFCPIPFTLYPFAPAVRRTPNAECRFLPRKK